MTYGRSRTGRRPERREAHQPTRAAVEPLEIRRLLCADFSTHLPAPATSAQGSTDFAASHADFGPVPAAQAAAADFEWRTEAEAPLARFEAQGAAVNGKLYVIGGFYNTQIQATARVDAFDPTTGTWTRRTDMPEPVTHAGQAADGDLVYVAGGFLGDHPGGSVNSVWVYDTATDTWSPGPALPADRGGGGLVRLGRELHFFGGATREAGTEDYVDHGEHWVLQLGEDAATTDDAATWTTAAPLPNPRNHIGGAAAGGKVYAVGGQHKGDEVNGNQKSVHAYDPATDTWAPVADLPRGLGHVTASTFEMDGRVVVAGGVTRTSAEVGAVIEYDPAGDVWYRLPSLPDVRQSPVAGAVGGTVYVSGGSSTGPQTTTWSGNLGGGWQGAPGGLATMPVALSEVAGGVIDDRLYLVGGGDPATLVYDLSDDTWSTAATARPFVGDHHAAEVFDGKLYLFGGLGGGSEGRVQIYDPAADAWTAGAAMPFAAGSSSTALIDGQIYLAGGIVGPATTDRVARYDPAANTWTERAAMPQGRNHAASATDGDKLYVFGGRGPGSGDGSTLANGFGTTQIYDPATDTWTSSQAAGSTLAPLPQARGGMGKAVFLSDGDGDGDDTNGPGEFFVIGGETATGPGATPDRVYGRVDVYDGFTNTWRSAPALPTARHGIFPLSHDGRIYVAGRHVYYNNSAFDGGNPAADAQDDAAVAPDKRALLPGQIASFAHYTSYVKGINGVMIDVANLPQETTVSADDFQFRAGNDNAPAGWAAAPAPSSVTVRRGAGTGGADRITLVWPDNQIQKQWLQVTMTANADTGLAAADVFYFGNAVGESGNHPRNALVNGADNKQTRRNRAATAALDSRFDFDRNGAVDDADRLLTRQHRTARRTALRLITAAPAGG